METKISERREMINNIIVTAIEAGLDGIQYWAAHRNYDWEEGIKGINKDHLIRAEVEIVEHEDLDDIDPNECTKWVKLDHKLVSKGIRILMDKSKYPHIVGLHDDYRKRLVGELRQGEDSDLDSSDADIIIQVGLFGKVIYG